MESGSLSLGPVRRPGRLPFERVEPFGRWDPAIGPGVVGFAIALAFYAATLLPGVAFWDTGEMQTVPYILGIAHPTGFPLFVLTGWLFGHAFPLGSPAWRLSLFSALATAAAAGCLAACVTDLCRQAWAGVGAATTFALGEVAWTRAVRAEVHDLALLCIAVAVTAAARAADTRSPRALAVAGLACGLGVATHPIAALAIPGLVLIAWPAVAAVRGRELAATVALAVAPLALYAYVPLRSAFVESHGLDPEMALGVTGGAFWDDDAPAGAASFLRYVTGSEFEPGRSLASAFDGGGIAHIVTLAAATAYREYSFLVLALALCGLTYLALQRPFVAGGLVAIAASGLVFAANFTAESDIARYLLGGLWVTAAAAGVGAWWLASSLVGERPAVAALLGCALLAGGLWPNAPAAAAALAVERKHADARSFASEMTRRVVPHSLVIASWAYATPLAYEAYVTGTFHARLLCGWPRDYAGRFVAWRREFGHVYVVVEPNVDLGPFARRLYATDRYQLAEISS